MSLLIMNGENVFKYFAYGSNLLPERILINNPSAKFVSQGTLKGYRLFFDHCRGLDDIDPWNGASASIRASDSDEECCVRGVVWHISLDQMDRLDRQETGYHAISVNVLIDDGQTVPCRTYQITDCVGPSLPNPYYKKVIVDGAKEHGLPEDYIQFLNSFPDTGDKEVPLVYKKILEQMGQK